MPPKTCEEHSDFCSKLGALAQEVRDMKDSFGQRLDRQFGEVLNKLTDQDMRYAADRRAEIQAKIDHDVKKTESEESARVERKKDAEKIAALAFEERKFWWTKAAALTGLAGLISGIIVKML